MIVNPGNKCILERKLCLVEENRKKSPGYIARRLFVEDSKYEYIRKKPFSCYIREQFSHRKIKQIQFPTVHQARMIQERHKLRG